MSEKKRVALYDWARLAAMVFVVIGHSTYMYLRTAYGSLYYEFPASAGDITSGFLFQLLQKLGDFFYEFHMPLFFIISGAVLALRPLPPLGGFLVSKFRRLIIPYYLYGCLFMLPIKFFSGFYDASSLIEVIKSFLIGEESGHLWFLGSLFWCMTVFACLKKITDRFGEKGDLLLLFPGIAAYYLWSYIPFDFLNLKLGMSYFLFFLIGYYFEKTEIRKRLEVLDTKILCLILAVFLGIVYLHHRFRLLDWFFGIMTASITTFLFCEAFERILPDAASWKFWKILMRSLFYVYLFHDPLNFLILKLSFSSPLVSSPAGCIIYLFLRSVGVFTVSLLLGEAVNAVKRSMMRS